MKKQKNEQTTDDLIRDQMIIQLGLAGLTQHQIREIVGVDIHRVNRIVKHFKNLKKIIMAKAPKDPVPEKLDTAVELLKDLLIAQLASMEFSNDQIKKVVGKIDNNRLRRIVSVHNKITRQKAKQQKKHG